MTIADPIAETTDLLQHLIRNACVNDGTVASGAEVRSVDVLESVPGRGGIDVQRFEPQPGRASLVARIEGSDPTAASLLLMGHTDVVPVNRRRLDAREPFSGDLVDGFVWGRGAVDMLNITASQAVAFRRLADSGFRPKGTLIYLAVADEEALGTWGARWLVEHERDAVYADYVLTESGGYQMPTADGVRLPVLTAEKGTFWSEAADPRHAGPRLAAVPHRQRARHRGRGGPAHRRVPAADARSTTCGGSSSRGWSTPRRSRAPSSIRQVCATRSPELPLGMSRLVHACTHTTFAPTIIARGHQDQRDPRPRRARSRHPHDAGSGRRRGARDARRGARRPRRPCRDRVQRRPRDGVTNRDAAVGHPRRASRVDSSTTPRSSRS